jgi:hypothetical protein
MHRGGPTWSDARHRRPTRDRLAKKRERDGLRGQFFGKGLRGKPFDQAPDTVKRLYGPDHRDLMTGKKMTDKLGRKDKKHVEDCKHRQGFWHGHSQKIWLKCRHCLKEFEIKRPLELDEVRRADQVQLQLPTPKKVGTSD